MHPTDTMKRRPYRDMNAYLRALENRAEKGCMRRLVRWFRDVRSINRCRELLWAELDRDRDESDSLRSLVVVAVNALHGERNKPAPYDIPAVKWSERPMRERIEWELRAAWNREGLPEMPEDFVGYVTERILSANA